MLRSLAPLPGVALRALASRSEAHMAAAARAWADAAGRTRPGGTDRPPRFHRHWESLIADPAVEVVLITTPPHLHAAVTRAALEAGRHVFVEKPGALDPADLEGAAALAARRGLAAAPDFVMRWNPLWRLLAEAARAGLLGRPERAAVENHAHGDLPPEHWFWDPARSGGILVEHGVHFFDLMTWLLGAPLAVQATALPHPAGPHLAPDRVLAVATHAVAPVPDGPPGGGATPDPAVPVERALVSYYHAFTRPSGLARAWTDLSFERGAVRVVGWTAHVLEATLYLLDGQEESLRRLLPPGAEARVETARRLAGERRSLLARGRPLAADLEVRLRVRLGEPEAVYAACVRAGFSALLARVAGLPADPAAPTLGDAAGALRLAVAARAAAETGRVVAVDGA